MQIVKCPYCSRKLKLSHPVANAKLQCRYCMKLFVGTSYSDEQPLVKQPASKHQQPAPSDEFGELTDLVDVHEPPGRPGTMPIPARHAPSSAPVHGHAPARPTGSPPKPTTGHAPKPAGQQRPQAAKPVAKSQVPADDPFADMGGQDAGGEYGLSGEQEQQQQEQQAQSDDPFAALVGASSAPAAKPASGRPRAAAAGHQQAHGQERPTFVKPKKSPVAIIVIACVAVLAIAGIIVAVVMNSGEEKKSDDKTANTTAQAAQSPGAKADAEKETPKTAAPANKGQASAGTEGQTPAPENQAGQTAAAGQTPAAQGEQKTSPEEIIKENLKVSYKFQPNDESMDKSEGTFYGNLTNDNDMAFENVKITPIAVNGESQNPLPEVAITVRYVPPKSTIKFAAESNRLSYAKSEFDASKYSVTYAPLPANQIIITSVKCDSPIATEDGGRLKTTGRATNSTALTLTNIKIYIEYFTTDGMKTGGTFDGVELKGGTKSLTPGASEAFTCEYDPTKKTSELPDMIKAAVARMIATKPN